MQADAAKVNELNARTQALTQRIEEWNAKWQEFEKSGRSGPLVDRQRRRLVAEKREMEEEERELTAQREALGGVGGGAAEVNAKVEALNVRTVAWNERNKGMVKRGEDLALER
ncbi:hypothetical protein RZS08_42160, partial [Arthrospira platensis SPKY1]|nr:hypothetical protein [Arthrospira platensis SPKY1]